MIVVLPWNVNDHDPSMKCKWSWFFNVFWRVVIWCLWGIKCAVIQMTNAWASNKVFCCTMFECMYVYMCVYILIPWNNVFCCTIFERVYVYMCVYIWIPCIWPQRETLVALPALTFLKFCLWRHIRVCIHAYIHTYTHRQTYVYEYIHIHIHITHMHIHIHYTLHTYT